jgi:hypothetical protein
MTRFTLFIAFLSLMTLGCRSNLVREPLIDPDLTVAISGKITCPSNQIPNTSNIKISIKGSTGYTNTIRPNADGKFQFTGLTSGVDYDVKVSRDADPNLNMSSFSLTELSLIILDINRAPTSILGLLAADFDNSGEIDPTDLLYFRRIISGTTSNDLLWRFVSNDLVDGTNTNTRAGGVNILRLKNLTSDANNCNFFLLRMGNISLNECQ